MKKAFIPALLLALFVSPCTLVRAQTGPTAAPPAAAGPVYRFMQFIVVQGNNSYMSFAPAFVGQRIISMSNQYLSGAYSQKAQEKLLVQEDLVMRELESVSAAGWELVQVSTQVLGREQDQVRTTYLFRQLK